MLDVQPKKRTRELPEKVCRRPSNAATGAASMKSETSLPAARARFPGLYMLDVESILLLTQRSNNEMGRFCY
jgi:hypothetical protein